MTEIIEYLQQNRPDYQTGIDLLERYGGAGPIVRSLRFKRPVTGLDPLRKELRKLLDQSQKSVPSRKPRAVPKAEKATATPKKKRQKVEVKATTPIETPDFMALMKYKGQQFAKMAKLRNALEDTPPEKRPAAIDLINELDRENRLLHEELDYFRTNGKWKNGQPPFVKEAEHSEETEPASQSVSDLKYSLTLVRQRISRAKSSLRKLEEGSEKYLAKRQVLQQLEAERNSITSKIEALS